MTTIKSKPAPSRARVRRGNLEDAEQLRKELVDAALALFADGGLEAVSIRSVSARVGVSPMAMYRYFADKAELLSGVSAFAQQGSYEYTQKVVTRARGGRARHRAAIEAFLDYWESHPDQYCLVYGFSEIGPAREAKSRLGPPPKYADYLAYQTLVTEALAREIGAPLTHVKLAQDLRIAMLLGYLHGTMVFRRYPWSEPAQLREAYVEQVQQAVERCLLQGPAAAAR